MYIIQCTLYDIYIQCISYNAHNTLYNVYKRCKHYKMQAYKWQSANTHTCVQTHACTFHTYSHTVIDTYGYGV